MNYKKLFVALFSFTIFALSFFVIASQTQAATDVKGWGWSSNIGWVSFNCVNTNGCASSDYKVMFATTTTTGTFSGHAWSPNIGWISFNETDATHSKVTTDVTTGTVTGWAKALAGGSEGWDGWIRMSDTTYYPTGYLDGSKGITFDPTTGLFKGYSWGDMNVGWLSFNVAGPTNGVSCLPGCQTVTTPSSFSFEVSNGSGWSDDVTVTAGSNNSASVQVRWDPVNVSLVKLATSTISNTSDWPGAGVDATSYSGTPLSSYGQVAVSFANITSITEKELAISYVDENDIKHIKTVSITINPYVVVAQPTSCIVPANAQLCTSSNPNSNSTPVLRTSQSSCTSTLVSPITCEFYCPTGYQKVGNICRKPGSIENI